MTLVKNNTVSEKIKKIIFIATITTLMGQVYINPFGSNFRTSLGIVALSLLIIEFEDVPIFLTNVVTAFFIFSFRFFSDYISHSGTVYVIIERHFPAVAFYLVFGLMLSYLNIRQLRDLPIKIVLYIGLSDVISNIIEAFIRDEFISTPFNIILTRLSITGFSRAFITFLLYTGLRFYNVLLLRDENRQKYEEFIFLAAKMKSEAFFLNKTMRDIECAMDRSYSIYNDLKNENMNFDNKFRERLKERMLNLSKDIHEIKKDNQRVVFGIEGVISKYNEELCMSIRELLNLLKENTTRAIESKNRNIQIFVDVANDFFTKEGYPLISIINNLIANSIDAIDKEGYININVFTKEDTIFIEIIDNGEGIKIHHMRAIFEPGFSTKFNRETGKMSTGIGLTHVKEIVENHFGGEIYIDSRTIIGTKFTIEIPEENIVFKEV